VCKTNLLTHSASLPRPARATRLPSLVESQQLQLELRELERSPMVGSSPRDQQVHNQHNHQTELSTLITLSDQEKIAMSQDQERPPLPPKPSTPSFSNFIIAPQPFRRSDGDPESPSLAQQAIQSWRRISEDISKQSPDLRPRSQENLAVGRTLPAAPTPAAQVRRSFVPPVRDEEHEIQRKAHAKRVRETRRSTQGVTLEDLKSAEQLVKKKQQQENATRTTELQQLASAPAPPSPSPPTASTHLSTTSSHSAPSTTVTTSATLNLQVNPAASGGRAEDQDRGHERRPSWRLRIESGDKSRFTLEDTVKEGVVSTNPPSSSRLSHNSSHQSPTEQRRTSRLEAARNHALHHQGDSETPGSPTTGLTAVQRKKKPKRRSTGVLSAEDIGPRSDESADENGASPTHDTHETSPLKSNLKTNGGGQVDYKKLWEESQEENSRLRSEMEATRQDLDSTRQQLDSAIQVLAKNSVSDIEKREKKVLEKKLGEMEDELKQLQKLKSENEKLKSENRALTRVVSKLTSAASKAVPATPGPVNRK